MSDEDVTDPDCRDEDQSFLQNLKDCISPDGESGVEERRD